VVALYVARTFWEKATILHAEHHRPAHLPVRDRFARHYSDFASLWRQDHARMLQLTQEWHDSEPFIDKLNRAEKLGMLPSAEQWQMLSPN